MSDSVPTLELTQRALHIFFSLLYNAALTHDQCMGYTEADLDDDWIAPFYLIDLAVLVCLYAEYAGCLDVIGPRMLATYQWSPHYWKAIGTRPREKLLFAIKLGNEDIYQDAMRHVVAQAHLDESWKEVVDLGKNSQKHVLNFYKPQLERLICITEALKRNLQKLQFDTVRAKKDGRWHKACTRFLDAARFKRPDRVQCVVRAMWGGLMTYEFLGDKITKSPTGLIAEDAG
jgi:hypothetical protein